MERYVINGKEVEYDTFDLENMEIYDREVRKVEEAVKIVDTKNMGDNYIAVLRNLADTILDFFDAVLGDGMAREIFGERTNIRDIKNGYRDFTQGVVKEMGGLSPNREQRRHAK